MLVRVSVYISMFPLQIYDHKHRAHNKLVLYPPVVKKKWEVNSDSLLAIKTIHKRVWVQTCITMTLPFLSSDWYKDLLTSLYLAWLWVSTYCKYVSLHKRENILFLLFLLLLIYICVFKLSVRYTEYYYHNSYKLFFVEGSDN